MATPPIEVDPRFNPRVEAVGSVYAFARQQDGKLLIGGVFQFLDGVECSGLIRLNSDSTLDTGFRPTLSLGAVRPEVHSVAVQPDGRILIGGRFELVNGVPRYSLARLEADGELDTSFAPQSLSQSEVRVVTVDVLGRILAGGQIRVPGTDPGSYATRNLVRFSPEGVLDRAFARGGDDQWVHSILILPNQDIIVAGYFSDLLSSRAVGLARLHPDGSEDASFVPQLENFGGLGRDSVRRDSSGRLLVAGSFTAVNGVPRRGVARLLADGSVDTTFDAGSGPAGVAGTAVWGVVVEESGSILVNGSFESFSGQPRRHVVRLDPNGTVDLSFDAKIATTSPWTRAAVVALDNNGQVLVGGWFSSVGSAFRGGLARFSSIGELDAGFPQGAYIPGSVNSLFRDDDGQLLVGGGFDFVNGRCYRNVVRLRGDGSVDPAFAEGSGTSDQVHAIAGQRDGRIVLGGWFKSVNGTERPYLARLHVDGRLDTSFDPGAVQGGSCGSRIRSIALDALGRILVGGCLSSLAGTPRRGVARLLQDGSVDVSFDPGVGTTKAVASVHLDAQSRIIVGGDFESFAGEPAGRIARLLPSGAVDTAFQKAPGANGSVTQLLSSEDGRLLAVGYFTKVHGESRAYAARVLGDGTLDAAFLPPPAHEQGAFLAASTDSAGRTYVAGWYLDPGDRHTVLLRLKADGSVDEEFEATVTDVDASSVSVVASDSSRSLLVGGNFSGVKGTTRVSLARLLLNDQPPRVRRRLLGAGH